MSNILAISLVVALAIVVIILLIWKNRKDKKLLNPEGQESVEETAMDHERRRNTI